MVRKTKKITSGKWHLKLIIYSFYCLSISWIFHIISLNFMRDWLFYQTIFRNFFAITIILSIKQASAFLFILPLHCTRRSRCWRSFRTEAAKEFPRMRRGRRQHLEWEELRREVLNVGGSTHEGSLEIPENPHDLYNYSLMN